MIRLIPMAVLDTPAVLLARPAGGSAMQDGKLITWLIVLGVAIAAICVAAVFFSRWLKRRQQYSHSLLFRSLCRAHGLGMRDRRLLLRIATLTNLSAPARVFTEPAWSDPARLPGSLKSQAKDLVRLREQIFSYEKANAQTNSPQSA